MTLFIQKAVDFLEGSRYICLPQPQLMSGIEFNLAPLPLLASAAFYLTSALISFLQSLVFLRLSFRLTTLLSTNKTKTKKTEHFPWFISLFIQEVHFEVSREYSITQLEKKKSDKQVFQQKYGRLEDKSLDRANSADIATIKRNVRRFYIIRFKWLLQWTIDTENIWSRSFHCHACHVVWR